MSPPASLHRRTIPRFLTVGAVCTLISLFIIFAAKALFQARDVSANFLGYAVGICINYALNAKWTFEYHGSALSAFTRFLLVVGVAYLSNLAAVLFASNVLEANGYIAQLMGVPPYAAVSYLLSRRLVFGPPSGLRSGSIG